MLNGLTQEPAVRSGVGWAAARDQQSRTAGCSPPTSHALPFQIPRGPCTSRVKWPRTGPQRFQVCLSQGSRAALLAHLGRAPQMGQSRVTSWAGQCRAVRLWMGLMVGAECWQEAPCEWVEKRWSPVPPPAPLLRGCLQRSGSSPLTFPARTGKVS